ncbi:DUF5627 domain-containing protein [Chitinophaga lutea]
MKRLLAVLLAAGLFGCKNDPPVFPDYDYTTVYFPFQYPVRTLVLGKYELDNERDNKLQFLISTRVGGMYDNHSDWKVDFALAPELAQNLQDGAQPLEILPAKYFTLNPVSQMTVPKGQFTGETVVQLTEQFLDDPMAWKRYYVIPVRITKSTTDSILSGRTLLQNPDRRIAGDWSVAPKDFTIFAIKFINAYHGKYLRRGQSLITNATGMPVETIVYRQPYIEQDEVCAVATAGRSKVTLSSVLRASAGSPGNYSMDLTFDAAGNCTVSTAAGSAFAVTGTGKFEPEAGEWGNKKRDVITLAYKVTQGTNTHTVKDTLVFRDKDVRFEELTPVVKR